MIEAKNVNIFLRCSSCGRSRKRQAVTRTPRRPALARLHSRHMTGIHHGLHHPPHSRDLHEGIHPYEICPDPVCCNPDGQLCIEPSHLGTTAPTFRQRGTVSSPERKGQVMPPCRTESQGQVGSGRHQENQGLQVAITDYRVAGPSGPIRRRALGIMLKAGGSFDQPALSRLGRQIGLPCMPTFTVRTCTSGAIECRLSPVIDYRRYAIRFGQRQNDVLRQPLHLPVGKDDLAAEPLDDLFRDRQPKACSR